MNALRRFLESIFAPKLRMTVKWTFDDGEPFRCEYRLTQRQLTEMTAHIPKTGTMIDNRLITETHINIE